MNWTQPVCETCWGEKNPGRKAIRLRFPEERICCFCGNSCVGDIWVRIDPRTVPFPLAEENV